LQNLLTFAQKFSINVYQVNNSKLWPILRFQFSSFNNEDSVKTNIALFYFNHEAVQLKMVPLQAKYCYFLMEGVRKEIPKTLSFIIM